MQAQLCVSHRGCKHTVSCKMQRHPPLLLPVLGPLLLVPALEPLQPLRQLQVRLLCTRSSVRVNTPLGRCSSEHAHYVHMVNACTNGMTHAPRQLYVCCSRGKHEQGHRVQGSCQDVRGARRRRAEGQVPTSTPAKVLRESGDSHPHSYSHCHCRGGCLWCPYIFATPSTFLALLLQHLFQCCQHCSFLLVGLSAL